MTGRCRSVHCLDRLPQRVAASIRPVFAGTAQATPTPSKPRGAAGDNRNKTSRTSIDAFCALLRRMSSVDVVAKARTMSIRSNTCEIRKIRTSYIACSVTRVDPSSESGRWRRRAPRHTKTAEEGLLVPKSGRGASQRRKVARPSDERRWAVPPPSWLVAGPFRAHEFGFKALREAGTLRQERVMLFPTAGPRWNACSSAPHDLAAPARFSRASESLGPCPSVRGAPAPGRLHARRKRCFINASPERRLTSRLLRAMLEASHRGPTISLGPIDIQD